MKIKNDRGHEVEISDFIENEIDGSDQERGQIETTEATAENSAKAIGNLISILREKNLIDDEDVKKVVSGIW